jgi:hypothetical protein
MSKQRSAAKTRMTDICKCGVYMAPHDKFTHRRQKEQRAAEPQGEATPTPWMVGPDYEHKEMKSVWFGSFATKATTVAQTIKPQDAELIVRAVNAYDNLVSDNIKLLEVNTKLQARNEELLEVCKLAFERLKPKGNVRKDYGGHVAMSALSTAIAKAEGK